MRVPERYICDRNMIPNLGSGLGNGDGIVCERRPANLAKCLIPHEKTLFDVQLGANVGESLLLASFRPLTVADMESGNVFGAEVADSQRGANRRIHTAGENYDGFDFRVLI